MESSSERLEKDLAILEAMAAEMEQYLREDILFWRMAQGGMPMLTLGSYLMRQHRLVSLASLLTPDQLARLNQAVAQYDAALVEKVVRLEQKGHTELDARLRQWSEYLNDAEWQRYPEYNNYANAVETRAMIAALLDQLNQPPYELQPDRPARLQQLDTLLRAHWESGEFIWPPDWQPAYPQARYWWLYGRPHN
ncbi:MAG: hypothetical protein KC425_14455 [Anaerolineales bacterium]|nr:hypothetical protein [Anaerolineales bacterium]